MKSDSRHPAERYARGVVSGQVVAGKWVRLACERHVRDLTEGSKRGLHFDAAAAQRPIDFIQFLPHSKGRWAGQPFDLQPWQQFILYSLFGWKKADGARRFRVGHVEIARKNGKTTLWAAVALYLLFADGEPGAEVYCAATKKDQAKILFSEAERMRSGCSLKKHIVSFRNNLNVPATASKFEPLGSDADTLDGLNVHGAVIDEFHEHRTRELWDKLETATGARRQPLIATITTAGHDRHTICWQQHEYAERILEQISEDDSFFAYVASLDAGDDWQDEATWPKANPNLRVSVTVEELRERAQRPKQDPSSLNSFLRYRLNLWTNQEIAAIRVEDWNECAGQIQAVELAGRPCYVGIDLSSTDDVTAVVKVFPPEDEDEPYAVLCDFWLPEENVARKIAEHRLPFDAWIQHGFLRATEGNVVDYDAVQAQLLADCELYQVREVGFDPWNATQFANNLQKAGIDPKILVKFPQTISMFAEPTKLLLETLIPSRRLAHFGHPVLSWMAGNLLVKEDANGNRRPVRGSKSGKVDGMVALIMALGRAIASPDGATRVYSGPEEVFTV